MFQIPVFDIENKRWTDHWLYYLLSNKNIVNLLTMAGLLPPENSSKKSQVSDVVDRGDEVGYIFTHWYIFIKSKTIMYCI